MLPFNFIPTAGDFISLLGELHEAGKGSLPMSDLIKKAGRLRDLAAALEEVRASLAAAGAVRRAIGKTGARIARLNRGMMALSRILNPALYTVEGPYDHDPALQAPMLPGLQAVRRLAAMAPDSDDYGFLRARLVRERNRVADALDGAAGHVEVLLSQVG